MKILFLSPQAEVKRVAIEALQSRGVALLLPLDASEAWQMLQLHGKSVVLAILHREGASGTGTPGLELIAKLKTDPNQSDLPVILTSQTWGDPEFAKHQETPEGAHAYLRTPFAADALVELVQAVTGATLPSPAGAAMETPAAHNGGIVLEPTDAVFGTESGVSISGGIQLESPVTGEIVAPTAVELSPIEEPPVAEPTGIEISEHTMVLSEIPTAEDDGEPQSAPEIQIIEEPAPTLDVSGDEAESELPYLFQTESKPQSGPSVAALLGLMHPIGDAVVPGGAAQSPDTETLKKYLLLREQDVAALSAQLRTAREQVSAVEEMLKRERSDNEELRIRTEGQKRKLDDAERDRAIALEALNTEIGELKFQVKAKADKARVMELKIREATDEMERLKERVRSDIRKIRLREKELENRLEIMKKDSEALIAARENKIVELKRKVDLLEFNMDLLQDSYNRERESATVLRERLAKAAQVVRVAGGLLDSTPGQIAAKEAILDDDRAA